MANFQFKKDANIAKQREGGVGTGVHKVKITKAIVTETKNGNNILDVYMETMAGQKFAVYGMCIDDKWSSGAENFDYPTFMELAMVVGMETGDMYDTEQEVTRDSKKVKEACKAFKELENKVIHVAVYTSFELNKDKTKEVKNRKFQRIFNEAGLSLTEIEAGKTTGKAMAKVEDKIADYETKAWKEWKANGGAGNSSASASEPAESVAEDTVDESEDLI